jgi:predicted dinucleotide-binding enzyme
MSLDAKRAIVVGGASDIGFTVATLSRQLGVEVVIAPSNATSDDAAVEQPDRDNGPWGRFSKRNQRVRLLRGKQRDRSIA